MSDHNQEAERAAPGISDAEIAGIMGWRGPGAYTEATLRKIRRVLEEDRARRLPVVGDDGLPPLPSYVQSSFPHGYDNLYSEGQIRQYARDAIAADRAARAQQQAQSVGEDEQFRKLFFAAKHASWNFDERTPELDALIAYIDGRTAGAAPELYTCIGKGGTYAHVGVAAGAGYTRGGLVHVYRDQATGNLFYRTPADFDARMERIAAAPSPQPGKEGGNEN